MLVLRGGIITAQPVLLKFLKAAVLDTGPDVVDQLDDKVLVMPAEQGQTQDFFSFKQMMEVSPAVLLADRTGATV